MLYNCHVVVKEWETFPIDKLIPFCYGLTQLPMITLDVIFDCLINCVKLFSVLFHKLR